MNKVKRQRAILVISMLSAYFAFSNLYDFYSVSVPEIEGRRAAVEKQVESKKMELAKLREFAKNIESVKQELRELDIQLETALEVMPRTANFAELLRRMDMLAENSGVELQLFRPMSATARSEPNAFYTVLKIDFTVVGSFAQSLVFFDQISRLKRLVNVEQIRFQKDSSSHRTITSTSDFPVRIAGVIKVFQFNDGI